MTLIALLVALGCLQFWGAANPLHRDEYYFRFCQRLAEGPFARYGWALPFVVIGGPVLMIAAVSLLLPAIAATILAIVILLFALGRGEFAAHLDTYKTACGEAHWQSAVLAAEQQGANTQGLEEGAWSGLNLRVLEAVAYQGFERLFAVVFWFVLLGPAGALLYRLIALYSNRFPGEAQNQWLWLMEWPAVRILSLSLAVTGNFVGCVNRWKYYFLCTSTSSAEILRDTVLGALSVDDELVQSCDCTRREISALKSLYRRTLWFWVSVVAIFTILY